MTWKEEYIKVKNDPVYFIEHHLKMPDSEGKLTDIELVGVMKDYINNNFTCIRPDS